LVIVFFIYGLIYYYFKRRFLKPFWLEGAAKKYANLALFLFVYSTFLPFFLMRFHKEPVGMILWFAWLVFGFIFTLFPLSIIKDVLTVVPRAFKKIKTKIVNKQISPGDAKLNKIENEMSRRDFLIKSNFVVLGISAALTGYGAWQARRPPQVYRVTIPIPGLPDHLAGFKIAQISDIHVGLLIDGKYLAEIVRRVNELKPDLVAITGDLVDGTVSQLREQTACLMDLASVHGSYFITGNHEYYSGVEEWLVEVERLGMKVLMNNHDVIRHGLLKKTPRKRSGKGIEKNLVIAGVPDQRAGPNAGHLYDPLKAVQGANVNDIKILLAHQPVAIDQSLAAGYHLQLSGHTHGGQFFPYNIGVSLIYRYNAGLYSHISPNNDTMWVYVNRGTGYWGPPVRTGVPSEITLLTLEKG
jgi:hypothetical protein